MSVYPFLIKMLSKTAGFMYIPIFLLIMVSYVFQTVTTSNVGVGDEWCGICGFIYLPLRAYQLKLPFWILR